MQVVVGRGTERSEAGRKSPESGTLGGAQSFGVTERATVSPKVCAPWGIICFVLVVSDLKPDPRAGDMARAGCKFDTTSLAWGERSRDWQPAWP